MCWWLPASKAVTGKPHGVTVWDRTWSCSPLLFASVVWPRVGSGFLLPPPPAGASRSLRCWTCRRTLTSSCGSEGCGCDRPCSCCGLHCPVCPEDPRWLRVISDLLRWQPRQALSSLRCQRSRCHSHGRYREDCCYRLLERRWRVAEDRCRGAGVGEVKGGQASSKCQSGQTRHTPWYIFLSELHLAAA